jgi:cytochrome P450
MNQIFQTFGTLMVFVMAMLLYPDVLRKAQAELDAVIGRERIPTFEDRDNLPFIRAMVKETLRWRPVGPLG